MYATIITVVINAILDPVFIFGFGWGIRGAAIATVLAQVISLVWQFRILSDKSELLHFRRGIYRLRKKIVRDMLAIGMSPFLMNLAAAFGSLVGVGAATLISMRLGQRDYETAQRVLGNVLVLNLIIGVSFGLVTLAFLDPILYFFGANEATIG